MPLIIARHFYCQITAWQSIKNTYSLCYVSDPPCPVLRYSSESDFFESDSEQAGPDTAARPAQDSGSTVVVPRCLLSIRYWASRPGCSLYSEAGCTDLLLRLPKFYKSTHWSNSASWLIKYANAVRDLACRTPKVCTCLAHAMKVSQMGTAARSRR
ncbi:MAG: hypothetical protein ACI8UP_000943 [Porticoccaceae bacterium]|jgi:hypothetical protein